MATITPGVFVAETDAVPGTIVEVRTDVPVFIGPTERADDRGRDLTGVPVRIDSMADYARCFGGPAIPRFGVSTVAPGSPVPPADPDAAPVQIARFTAGGQAFELRREAGHAGGRALMPLAMRQFFDNGGATCRVVSVGGWADPAGLTAQALLRGLPPLLEEPDATLVLVPDAVLLDRVGCLTVQQRVLAHCAATGRCLAILDVWGGDRGRRSSGAVRDPIAAFREGIGSDHLAYGAAYYPWLRRSGVSAAALEPSMFTGPAAPTPAQWDAHRRAPAPDDVVSRLLEAATGLLSLVPPSAALAGVYTTVDRARGVWHAPANASLIGVAGPAVELSNAEQADLEVSLDGRSVNPIRSFTGRGTLVWGARTLDGNGQDTRYVSVRRTLMMIEESGRRALQAFVFEADDVGTWARVRSMFSNLLLGLWKQGALAGARPTEAFAVTCGLGETMTAADVAAGRLRVILMMALVRPAEFVTVTLEQLVTPPPPSADAPHRP